MDTYSAKKAYDKPGVPDTYEERRFSGFLGSYRYRREQKAISEIVDLMPAGVSVLDCPCGTGRWWPILSRRAHRIVGMDVSEKMLDFAKQNISKTAVAITLTKGDAERIALPDESVDYVFSHALTKHLPVPIQYQVLKEFSRVSRKGVICSFGIFSHITYEFWKRRNLIESYPVFLEELKWMADAANLVLLRKIKCTTPLGVEHAVLFRKRSQS